MSSSYSILFLVFIAGVALGIGYFASLWWTIRRLRYVKHPAYWVTGSALVRLTVVLVGFWALMAGRWENLLAAVLGFVVARTVMIRLQGDVRTPPPKEVVSRGD